MGKPYSDLEKRAIAILAGGGNPATSQDTAVANYWKWKINPSSNDHKLDPASTRTTGRKKDPVFLLPFGATLAANVLAKVQMTKRTADALTAQSAVKPECNHKTLATTDQGLRLRGYNPAYVYWREGAATSSTSRPSRITKRPYKSYYAAGDKGYLAPFGRKDGTQTELAAQDAIRKKFPAEINLISFTPEKYRG